MNESREMNQLAELADAVRDSTLTRLQLVPDGRENWRPADGMMSFADLVQHILDTDVWLLRKLQERELEPILGAPGISAVSTRKEYLELLHRLRESGEARSEYIGELSSDQIREKIFDARFEGEVTAWWIIVRGNLDHEIHHRGQTATYLRLLGIDS